MARRESFLTIEESPSGGDELQEDIVVADVGSEHNQAELLRLQDQDAVLQRNSGVLVREARSR
jgi:hypothetical protein